MQVRETSIIAQRSFNASGDKYDHHRRIIAALQFIRQGAFQDIANVAGLSYSQVGRRVNELVKDGKVKDSGTKGLSPSGLPATKWELTISSQQTKK